MPIYEFYCADCHTIFNFFSRTVNTRKSPLCPRCGKRTLDRQVSAFAIDRPLARRRNAAADDLPS